MTTLNVAVRQWAEPAYRKIEIENSLLQYLLSKPRRQASRETSETRIKDKLMNALLKFQDSIDKKYGSDSEESKALTNTQHTQFIESAIDTITDRIANKKEIKAQEIFNIASTNVGQDTSATSQKLGPSKKAKQMYLDVERGEEGQPKVVKRETSAVDVKLPNGEKVTISDVDLYRDVLSGKKVIKSLTRPSEGSIEDLQIRGIQTVLKNTVAPDIKVDGIFGGGSKAAVIKFQKNKGLSQDGAVGRQTISKMIKSRKDLDVPITGKSIDPELEQELLSQDVIEESRTRITEDRLRKLIRESLIKLM
jgi:hypothetical protein